MELTKKEILNLLTHLLNETHNEENFLFSIDQNKTIIIFKPHITLSVSLESSTNNINLCLIKLTSSIQKELKEFSLEVNSQDISQLISDLYTKNFFYSTQSSFKKTNLLVSNFLSYRQEFINFLNGEKTNDLSLIQPIEEIFEKLLSQNNNITNLQINFNNKKQEKITFTLFNPHQLSKTHRFQSSLILGRHTDLNGHTTDFDLKIPILLIEKSLLLSPFLTKPNKVPQSFKNFHPLTDAFLLNHKLLKINNKTNTNKI